jgi:hypothetical protein
MKINQKLINDIITQKVKITKEDDKIKLSEYDDFIPMFDIYTLQIYSVSKNQLHNKLIDSHYRFIDHKFEYNIIQALKKNDEKLINSYKKKDIKKIL